jgi:hypothetical protein
MQGFHTCVARTRTITVTSRHTTGWHSRDDTYGQRSGIVHAAVYGHPYGYDGFSAKVAADSVPPTARKQIGFSCKSVWVDGLLAWRPATGVRDVRRPAWKGLSSNCQI